MHTPQFIAPLFSIALAACLSFCLLLPGSSSFAQSRNDQQQIGSAIVPVLALLLDSDEISLRVGQSYFQSYTHTSYPDGIHFRLGSLNEDVEVSISLSGIPEGAELELLVNNVLVRNLVNGVNKFVVAASSLNSNSIRIRANSDAVIPWVISRIDVFLSQAGPRSRAQAQQFLMRATFGPTKQELDRVLEVGYEAWIDEQLSLNRSSSINEFNAHLDQLKSDVAVDVNNNGPTSQCNSRGFTDATECINYMHALLQGSGAATVRMDQWWRRTLRNPDQLRQRVVYALSQILVTSLELGDALRGRNRAVVVYEDVLSKNAFGNFRTLLEDVTLNPAMAYYLSFVGNQKAGRFGQPDENYAREILQLFSIGLVELNLDGTPKLDASGEEIETYTPETIQNLARIFTGWIYAQGSFVFAEWDLLPLVVWADGAFHDTDSKVLFGKTHPAGLSTEADLAMALDSIFNHPNVGPFIATRLIERLVMSNPPPAYVARVASVFNDNGQGVRGDLAAVVKAILLDPAAFASPDSATGGKIKEPVIAVAQLWRAFSAVSDIGHIRYANPAADFGQRPYDAPTVFNFYAPTDSTPALLAQGLVAPEFSLFKDDIVLNFLRRMYSLARSDESGADPVSASAPYSSDTRRKMQLNLSEAGAVANDLNALMDFYDERLLGGTMSTGLRSDIITFLESLADQGSDAANRAYRAEQALTVLTVSPEYNFQR